MFHKVSTLISEMDKLANKQEDDSFGLYYVLFATCVAIEI